MEFRDKPMENLMRLQEKDICKNVNALLLEGEQIVGAYKTVRDQVVFTSHRIIMVDMQGVTGTRQQLFVLPYRKVLHYGIQTAGFGDPLQASQLTVCFADGHEAKFGFIGQKDLFQVANAISAQWRKKKCHPAAAEGGWGGGLFYAFLRLVVYKTHENLKQNAKQCAKIGEKLRNAKLCATR